MQSLSLFRKKQIGATWRPRKWKVQLDYFGQININNIIKNFNDIIFNQQWDHERDYKWAASSSYPSPYISLCRSSWCTLALFQFQKVGRKRNWWPPRTHLLSSPLLICLRVLFFLVCINSPTDQGSRSWWPN